MLELQACPTMPTLWVLGVEPKTLCIADKTSTTLLISSDLNRYLISHINYSKSPEQKTNYLALAQPTKKQRSWKEVALF